MGKVIRKRKQTASSTGRKEGTEPDGGGMTSVENGDPVQLCVGQDPKVSPGPPAKKAWGGGRRRKKKITKKHWGQKGGPKKKTSHGNAKQGRPQIHAQWRTKTPRGKSFRDRGNVKPEGKGVTQVLEPENHGVGGSANGRFGDGKSIQKTPKPKCMARGRRCGKNQRCEQRNHGE